MELEREEHFFKGLGYTPITNITNHIMEEVAQEMREYLKASDVLDAFLPNVTSGSNASLWSQTCRISWSCLPPRRTWRTPACTSLPALWVLCSWTARPHLTNCASRTTSCLRPVITRSLLVKCRLFILTAFTLCPTVVRAVRQASEWRSWRETLLNHAGGSVSNSMFVGSSHTVPVCPRPANCFTSSVNCRAANYWYSGFIRLQSLIDAAIIQVRRVLCATSV